MSCRRLPGYEAWSASSLVKFSARAERSAEGSKSKRANSLTMSPSASRRRCATLDTNGSLGSFQQTAGRLTGLETGMKVRV